MNRHALAALVIPLLFCATLLAAGEAARPNVIMAMCDDLGWGDVAYNGNATVQTPCLDAMAREGLRFDRFYANSPSCSPTRAGCLTGRHPFRFGVYFPAAGLRNLPLSETTIAKALKPLGYATAHFGKWHLGGVDASNAYSPGKHGFDHWFSTSESTPTVDPTSYHEDGKAVGNLVGEDNQILLDRVLPYIRGCVERKQPFLVVLWFHTPHGPVVATPEFKARYGTLSDKDQHYFGTITAMDEQIGRLRRELRAMQIADNTMLWFTSDNGPAAAGKGSAGPLKSRKYSLWEGGVRVPGLLDWPARVKQPRTTDIPVCTTDFFPTVLAAAGGTPGPQTLDGIDLATVIDGTARERAKPLCFQTSNAFAKQSYQQCQSPLLTIIDGPLKLFADASGAKTQLYDLAADIGETRDLASDAAHSAVLERLRPQLEAWKNSVLESQRTAGIKGPDAGGAASKGAGASAGGE